MAKKHKLHYNGCIYNILGSNLNSHIGIKKITKSDMTYKPTVRVRTKAIRPIPNSTGRRFN